MATQKLEEKVQQHDAVVESSKSVCMSQSRAHGKGVSKHVCSPRQSSLEGSVMGIPIGECHEHFGRGVSCTEMNSRNVREGSVIKLSIGECHATIDRGVSSHKRVHHDGSVDLRICVYAHTRSHQACDCQCRCGPFHASSDLMTRPY